MAYIYLDDKETKELFQNHYLTKPKFESGKTLKKTINCFKSYDTEPIIKTQNSQETIFISQFKEVRLVHKQDKEIFNIHYNIPEGFLVDEKSKRGVKASVGVDSSKPMLDKKFLSIRRGLLNALSYFKTNKKIDPFFRIISDLKFHGGVVENLLILISKEGVFPQQEMTPQFMKKTKLELQFIKLGKLISDNKFEGNKISATDPDHNDWLMQLNPEKELKLGKIPTKFEDIYEIVIGYVLALKDQSFETSTYSALTGVIKDKSVFEINEKEAEKILFFYAFFTGLINENLDFYFHTDYSRNLMQAINEKAYELAFSNTLTTSLQLPKDIIQDICFPEKAKKKKSFDFYAKMVSGEVEEPILDSKRLLQLINFDRKDTLVFFFNGDPQSKKLELMLGNRELKNVLLVYEINKPEMTNDEKLSFDLKMAELKRNYRQYSNARFEVVLKNVFNKNNKEVVNNIRGFLKQIPTDPNVIFASDSKDQTLLNDHAQWMLNALSEKPLYNPEKDYLFVNSEN